MELEEGGIGFRSVEVGNTHTVSSRLAEHMIRTHAPSILRLLRMHTITDCMVSTETYTS